MDSKKRKPDGEPEQNGETIKTGVSRRGFITTVGATAGAAATLRPSLGEVAPGEITRPGAMRQIVLSINGQERRLTVEARWTLIRVLRDLLGLSAAKSSCERGECGSCTVLIDGQARYACMTLAVEAEGHRVETLEGLMDGENLTDLQQAFVAEDAYQCGYCTPGQLVAGEALLAVHPAPSAEEIRRGMSGNLCRCGAYQHIGQAIARTANQRAAKEGS